MDDTALGTRADGSIVPRFQKWLFEHRTRIWVWVVLLLLGLILGVLLLYGIYAFERWLSCTNDWLKSPGPWTLALPLAGGPVAWYVWFIRDRNKTADLRNARDQILHQDVEQAWVVFRQLQEWATGQNDTLQAAAIHQLKPFILGQAGGFIPKELIERDNPFQQPGLAILRALLDDRRWLGRWRERGKQDSSNEEPGSPARQPKPPSPPPAEQAHSESEGNAKSTTKPGRSPVMHAIENILSDPGLPTRDFREWNLSGLRLRKVQWPKADLRLAILSGAELEEADLSGARLWRANLSGAYLWQTNLSGARLRQANLSGADLSDADLSGADLGNAYLRDAQLEDADLSGADLGNANLLGAELDAANLSGANLGNANLSGAQLGNADLSGTYIDRKWKDRQEFKVPFKGEPEWIEAGEEEEGSE